MVRAVAVKARSRPRMRPATTQPRPIEAVAMTARTIADQNRRRLSILCWSEAIACSAWARAWAIDPTGRMVTWVACAAPRTRT